MYPQTFSEVSSQRVMKTYLFMLQLYTLPYIGDKQTHFVLQQDGFSPHWGLPGRAYMEKKIPGKWIGREGPLPLSPRFLDMITLEYSRWHTPQNMVRAWILTGPLPCYQGWQNWGVLRPVKTLRSLTTSPRTVHASSSFFSGPRRCEIPEEICGRTVYYFWYGWAYRRYGVNTLSTYLRMCLDLKLKFLLKLSVNNSYISMCLPRAKLVLRSK